MNLFKDVSALSEACKNGVVAIGNFDGLHHGHLELLRFTRAKAAEMQRMAGALTFYPHPDQVLGIASNHIEIMTLSERITGLFMCGMDFVVQQEFNIDFANISAEDFVHNTLVKEMQVSHVVVGYNFKFGNMGKGDAALLTRLGKVFGFECTQIREIRHESAQISSTIMRTQSHIK